MPASDTLKQLVDQMPDPDNRGMYTTNIDKGKIEQAIAEIHQGGRENVLGLIDLLGEPGSAEDVKPRYALHCLANHVLVAKDEAGRKALCEALAGQLGGDRPVHIQAYLCQELGWAGRSESVSALGKLLASEELSGPASMALVAIGEGAAAQFRAAWPEAKGEARRHIMDGLAAVAEPESAELLQAALGDQDREVRIAAGAGLASLGQAGAAGPLLKAADSAQGWERIQATNNCLVLAEKVSAAGNQSAAQKIYQQLQKRSEPHIREAAERGLAALG